MSERVNSSPCQVPTDLFVREHEYGHIAHLVRAQDAVQLLARLLHARAVLAVHHEDEALRALEVVAPQLPDLVLPAHVPHLEDNRNEML